MGTADGMVVMFIAMAMVMVEGVQDGDGTGQYTKRR